MRLSSDSERDGEPEERQDINRDLLCGIGPKHIRILCESGWNGGYGYTPQAVGDMTLDSIFMLLADRKVLRSVTRTRTMKVDSLDASLRPDNDGFIRGRAADGTPIKGKVGGTSKAARLIEAAQERKKQELASTTKRKRSR